MHGMKSWVCDGSAEDEVERDVFCRLGGRLPFTIWLVRLYARKLELLNPYGVFLRKEEA